jgi:hypothetical protein
MIYAQSTHDGHNFDNAYYWQLRAYDCALAIHERGDTDQSRCADVKIEACAVNRPHSYGLILRNVVRHQIDRFYSGWGNGVSDGVVLLEAAGNGSCRQCRLTMIEMEDFTDQNATAVTIRSEDGHTGVNQNYELHYLRAHQSKDQQLLNVDGAPNNPVRAVSLSGLMRPPEHDRAIELRHTEDCSLEYDLYGRTPPEGVHEENAIRTRYNGVGHNGGDPRSSGQWAAGPIQQNNWSSELPPADAGGSGHVVADEDSGALYMYAAGQWVQIGSGE